MPDDWDEVDFAYFGRFDLRVRELPSASPERWEARVTEPGGLCLLLDPVELEPGSGGDVALQAHVAVLREHAARAAEAFEAAAGGSRPGSAAPPTAVGAWAFGRDRELQRLQDELHHGR